MTPNTHEETIFRIHQLAQAMNAFRAQRVTGTFRYVRNKCELRDVDSITSKDLVVLLKSEVLCVDRTGLSMRSAFSNGIFDIKFEDLFEMLADDFVESTSISITPEQTLIIEVNADGRVSFKVPFDTYTDEENWNIVSMMDLERNYYSDTIEHVAREGVGEMRMASLRMMTDLRGKKRKIDFLIGNTRLDTIDLDHADYVAPLVNYFKEQQNGAVIPTKDGLILAIFDENALTLRYFNEEKPFYCLPYTTIQAKTGTFPHDLQKAYFDLLLMDGRYAELTQSLERLKDRDVLIKVLVETHPDDAQLKSIIEAAVLSRTLHDSAAVIEPRPAPSRIRRPDQ